jgi:hypothetical protein
MLRTGARVRRISRNSVARDAWRIMETCPMTPTIQIFVLILCVAIMWLAFLDDGPG